MTYYCPYLAFEFGMEYASFWRRLVAFAIDLVLLVFACFALAVLLSPLLLVAPDTTGDLLKSRYALPAAVLVIVLLNWLYFAGFESSKSQATIGKTTLEIAVADLNGEKVSFGRATVRSLAKLLSCLTLGVGFLIMIFSKRKQTLHDRIAGTVVIVKPVILPPPQL